MDYLFEEISAKVNELLLEQGSRINVQNVERVFEEKWSQVMAEALRKQRPSLEQTSSNVVSFFNAALLNLKSQFRKVATKRDERYIIYMCVTYGFGSER